MLCLVYYGVGSYQPLVEDKGLAVRKIPLKNTRVKKSERNKLAREALKAVNLADKAKNRGTDLSGGQRVFIFLLCLLFPKLSQYSYFLNFE